MMSVIPIPCDMRPVIVPNSTVELSLYWWKETKVLVCCAESENPAKALFICYHPANARLPRTDQFGLTLCEYLTDTSLFLSLSPSSSK